MRLIPLPAFADNYIWMLHNGRHAVVVDPGDAAPVWQALQREAVQLAAILVTHHHSDHVGGVAELYARTGAAIYGPAHETVPAPYTPLGDGMSIELLGLQFTVLDVPGHTAGHIAYYCAGAPDTQDAPAAPLLFCGDTLFSGGCGRLFEGTPAQMHASLQGLAALPGVTQVCCAHEYTLANLRFAQAVEPSNAELLHYSARCTALRSQDLPTLPSTIAQELAINPFLRTHCTAVSAAAQAFDARIATGDPVAVFAALRAWKNKF